MRWKAIITYRSEHGPIDVEHEFEEISNLADIIERGPNWYTLSQCVITLVHDDGRLTIEQAEKL